MEEVIEKYRQLDTEQKRNQINIELEIIGGLINKVETSMGITPSLNVKNYDSSKSDKLNEDEMLTFLYEDIFNIERELITLLTFMSNK